MSQPSTIPFGFRYRSHYTHRGEPKKALTVQSVRQILSENPDLEWYTCPECQQLHVGHRRAAS